MPDPAPYLEFQIAIAGWRRVPRLRARLQEAAAVTVAHLPKKFHFPFTANVLLTGNGKVRQLNRDFRGMDAPTNVLSFPQFTPRELVKEGKAGAPVELGDIALAYAYTAREAKDGGKDFAAHSIHLVVHGLLHLFGYDHMDTGEAEAMEKLEVKILHALGLPDPYAPQKPTPKSRGQKTSR